MEKIIFKRKIYDDILKWKEKSNGKTALLIEGARRVGKSTIVEEFAKKEYKSYILINFSKVSKQVKDLFENETDDFDYFFRILAQLFNTRLYDRESLIIFDEVQDYPRARQLVKYFVEDGRYDFIETGSLIRIRNTTSNITIPSEEDSLEMFPLDFEEFLWACKNDEIIIPFMLEAFNNKKPLGQVMHRKIMKYFREYILVGGMPQSINAYISSNSFEEADNAKRKIIKLYHEDLFKSNDERVVAVFDNIPGELSKKSKIFKYNKINEYSGYRENKNSFFWLEESMISNVCYNVTDPNVDLELSVDKSSLKCYMGDTGLLVSQMFLNKPFVDNYFYNKILFDKLSINEGMMMENIVAQMLKRNGYNLYFYSKVDHNNRSNNMEVDFLLTINDKVVPIEVKSSDYKSHSSLNKFRNKFSNIGTPIVLYTKDIDEKEGVLYLPIYMAMFL